MELQIPKILALFALSFALLIEQKLILLQSEVRQLDANTRIASLRGI